MSYLRAERVFNYLQGKVCGGGAEPEPPSRQWEQVNSKLVRKCYF